MNNYGKTICKQVYSFVALVYDCRITFPYSIYVFVCTRM